MNRNLTMILILVAVGLAVRHAHTQEQGAPAPQRDLASLRKERIRLLEDRVLFLEADLESRSTAPANRDTKVKPLSSEIVRAQIDLLNARLEYAGTNEAKKEVLVGLLKKYDVLIEQAEEAANAPIRPGVQNRHDASTVLFLRAERVRVQIELAELQ